jgi:hypothetical protein
MIMILHGHWVVEEDHQPIAGEMLQRPAPRADQITDGTVVVA